MGVRVRERYYQGGYLGKIFAIIIALADWIVPTIARKMCAAKERTYPITLSQWILMQESLDPKRANSLFEELVACAAEENDYYISWGLGFPWMSKNGLYDSDTPFITHTPYSMEALLHLARLDEEISKKALLAFDKTLPFLESLKIMYESEGLLAVSYAPVVEPRIVVNANAYAAFSYALHYKRQVSLGNLELAEECKRKAIALTRWIVEAQHEDGSWDYYADDFSGNFIDCFHSCFILKNLRKAGKLVSEIKILSARIETRGFEYIQRSFFVSEVGLVKRFTIRDIKDPFVWDLYDQAEYLGLLVDMGEIDDATKFFQQVTNKFKKKGFYYSKIDIFGFLWGKNYLRWGVMPFLYQQSRLVYLGNKQRI